MPSKHSAPASKRPALEGITLEAIVTELVNQLGWDALAQEIPLRCFSHDPSIKSSLTFLRRTPWARSKVEALYLRQSRHPPAGSLPADNASE
jgi:uncharacterized protein (DUF2132 family)